MDNNKTINSGPITEDLSNDNKVEVINNVDHKKINYKLPKLTKYRDPTEIELIAFRNICNNIATNLTVHQAVEKTKQLTYAQFNRIVASMNPQVLEIYARATEEREVIIFNQILEIADNPSEDMYLNDKGVMTPNPVAVQRDRLKIDARFKVLARLNNKKYGKVSTQQVDGTITIQPITGMIIE